MIKVSTQFSITSFKIWYWRLRAPNDEYEKKRSDAFTVYVII